MPFLSRSQLDEWREEFEKDPRGIVGKIRVLERYQGEADDDSGLIVVELSSLGIDTFLERPGAHGTRWQVTFTARDDDIALDSEGVALLAEELSGVAELCAFLEEHTRALLASS